MKYYETVLINSVYTTLLFVFETNKNLHTLNAGQPHILYQLL